jgi:hypothetical protein
MKIKLNEFLSPFYPDENESLRVRTFAQKEYPKYRDTRLPKPFGDIYAREYTITRASLADPKLQWQMLNENQLSGMYFIVNAGINEAKRLPIGIYARKSKQAESPQWTQYIKDEDITRLNAFFVEGDHKSIDEQLSKLERCPVQPSILVITRKSVHAYWLCAVAEVTVEEWIEVQTRLIAYFEADESIKNPSRVMRLPGFDHLSYDAASQAMDRKRVEVACFEPERRFAVDEMRASFPTVEAIQSSEWQAPAAGDSQYRTWQELGDELRRRMLSHPTAHYQGDKVVLQGVCHNGKGNSALFFNTLTGKYACTNDGCKKEDILRAFGLPERPTGGPVREGIVKRSRDPTASLNAGGAGSVAVSDFLSRFNPQLQTEVGIALAIAPDDCLLVPDEPPAPALLGKCIDCERRRHITNGFCFECSELRKFLNDGPNALTCGCSGARRWRLRDGGFRWYCGNCERDRTPLDAVWSFQERGNNGSNS